MRYYTKHDGLQTKEKGIMEYVRWIFRLLSVCGDRIGVYDY